MKIHLKTIRPIILLVILLMSVISKITAQTIITGLVTDSLDKPISFAIVSLLETTIGCTTDADGKYLLKVPQDGYYQLSASNVGYFSSSQNIYASGGKQKINIKLSVNYFKLNEVTIKSSNELKKKYYRLFIKQFIGDTHNSLSCSLLNPENLHIYKDSESDILKGFSIKPLQIENKALGYTIFYNLTDFNYDSKSGILNFAGNHYFQEIEGSTNKTKKWKLNRLFAYYGSRMHFLRSLYSDSLYNENFKISEFEADTANKLNPEFKALQGRDIVYPHNQISKIVFYKKPLLISFTDNHPELVYSPYGYKPTIYTSALIFSDSIRIYQNGMFENPFSVTWDGSMTNKRLADMLPFDYWPNQIKSNQNNNQDQKNRLKDQVFVHTDRNLYQPGDTIYFQAYIRDKISGEFESSGTSLYALLFNGQRELADSSRFKIKDAVSSGWMAIPVAAKSGKYRFVAFTSMMQNDDPKDAFQMDIRVDSKIKDNRKAAVLFGKAMYLPGDTIEAHIKISDLKDEPVRNQKLISTLQTGKSSIKLEESHTNKKGESVLRFTIPDTITSATELQIIMNKKADNSLIIKNFDIPFNDQSLDLRFLPEGGNLIEGLEQRIGFNATNSKGESVNITGLLKNNNGKILDTIRSGDYGPGLFTCKPEKGMYVELLNEAFQSKKWPLPNPNILGISLKVRPLNNRTFAIELQSNQYNGEKIFITGNMNSTQIFSQELKLDKKKRITINTGELPAGALQISLLDAEMKPVAERLFYVNADKHLKFNIRCDTTVYNPGQETELSVSVTDGQGNPESGYFSIAAVKAISGNDAEIFTPGIEYTFNYHPYFIQNLPSKVLLKGLENLTDEERDLFLMVYGWSKIHWYQNNENSVNKTLTSYDIMNMKILYALKSRKSDRKLDLVSLEGLSIKNLLTDSKGEISLSLDSLSDDTRTIILMPDSKSKKKVRGTMLHIPFNNEYFKNRILFAPQPTIPIDEYIKTIDYYTYSSLDSIIEIPEVSISGYVKKEFNDEYEEQYNYARVQSIGKEELWKSFSLQDAVRRLVVPLYMNDRVIYLRASRSLLGGPVPALIVLDGMPIYEVGWEMVNKMLPNDLKSVTVLDGPQGFTRYGERAQGGVVFINTLMHVHDPKLDEQYNTWLIKNKKDKMLIPFNIYRTYREFYNPGKEELNTNPILQERSTIFWQPDVYFDGQNPVKIKFPNLKHEGKVIVTINGVSENNLSGTVKASYKVFKSINSNYK